MRLLVATDHRFFAWDGATFDTYCFDRGFFDDYRTVFDEVCVAARMRQETPPAGARRADGDGVTFVPLPDVRGWRWTLAPTGLYLRALSEAVSWADAVCLRVPSVAAERAFAMARRLGRPTMFEMIGDPIAALQAAQHGWLAAAGGRYHAHKTWALIRGSACGSYVSRAHLQQRFPAASGAPTESISSIRLPRSEILPARTFDPRPAPLIAVLTASLVAVKCHDVLLRGVAAARSAGADVRLHLMGDGGLRGALEALAGELGIEQHTVFHGHVADRARMNAILDDAELFVMTSASEGMPRSMIEAMARGMPAIGSRAGGIAEILMPEQTFAPGDWHALGRMLTQIATDRARLNRYAQHSHATALEFSSDVLSARRQRLLRYLRERAEAARR